MEKSKRISHKEEFEFCYLRHQYLRRIEYKPSAQEIELYEKIVHKFGKNTFYVYKNLFLLVGLDLEDIVNISQVYLITFLGLFSLERNPKKLSNFKNSFKSHNSIVCTENDILDKNKADFTCFLKQRLQDLVRVCRQKSKNIKGLITEDFLVFTGTKRPPLDIEELLENHEKYKYKLLNSSTFKSIKKEMNENQEGPVFTFKNKWYVCVPIKKKALNENDIIYSNFDSTNNLYHMSPEEYYDSKHIARSFVEKNIKKPELEKEVKAALGFLEDIG